MNPRNVNIVVVGSKEDVADKMKVFAKNGIITYYDNYGNTIVPSEIKSAGDIKPEEILKKYADAIGGEKALKSIKDLQTTASGSMQGGVITILTYRKAPDKMKVVVNGSFAGNNMNLQTCSASSSMATRVIRSSRVIVRKWKAMNWKKLNSKWTSSQNCIRKCMLPIP
jgi:hypothetical protein